MEAQHWAGNERPKVNRGHATGACLAPWQFTGIDVFIAHCCLNRHVDAIEAANMPESYWFWRGGIELKPGDQE
jgi:hypothetical protein